MHWFFVDYFAVASCLVMAIACVNNLGIIFTAGIQDHTCVTPENLYSSDNFTSIVYHAGKMLSILKKNTDCIILRAYDKV